MNIDLDKAKRARAEAKGERDTVTFAGETFELPAEVPFGFADGAARGDWRAAMASLLNGQADRFFGLDPSVDDLVALVEGVAEAVQQQPGESSASRASSPRTSKSSRRASKPNTAST